MDIKRDFYLGKLVAARGDGFVKIVTGIRRCGKSHLLFGLFRKFLMKDGVQPFYTNEAGISYVGLMDFMLHPELLGAP